VLLLQHVARTLHIEDDAVAFSSSTSPSVAAVALPLSLLNLLQEPLHLCMQTSMFCYSVIAKTAISLKVALLSLLS
jgi:hypothetical protein